MNMPYRGKITLSLRRIAPAAFVLLAALTLLTACNGSTPTVVPTQEPVEPTPTATAVPPRSLTVCLGQEPTSLFPLNNQSAAARSVLAAVYDGPIDTSAYGYQPVILQRIPSLENGDAQLFQASVYVGDEVVDANGMPVTLTAGTKVRPAGCRSGDCAVTYDGKSEIKMDQMQVTFRLLPDLTWSDGEPLTAEDSLYTFTLASNPDVSGSSAYLISRTKSYEAADATTIQWWGKPGFIDPTYSTDFWMPLPKHIWSQFAVDKITDNDETARTPLGWGPYVIQEWVAGDHITLTKNIHYFRAGEGLPKFDTLTFRFVPDAETAISDLAAGTCDVLDPTVNLDGQVKLLRSMAEQNQLQALFTATPVMEQLAFGIVPATYDDGNNPDFDRADYFGDVRVRQAIAMCIDRQKIVDTVLYGLSSVPASFVPSAYPLADASVATYSFNPSEADKLLEQAGWRDIDNNPSTPRQAWSVKNIPSGTPLELNYITTEAAQRVQVSSLIANSLAQCGVKVNVQYVDQETLYASGPGGALFGRAFDLAEFAMGSTGTEPSCGWFTTSEIPNTANSWIGTNVSGYSNPAFDTACQAAEQSLMDEAAHTAAYQQAQAIFATDLPVLPLYWRAKVAAARLEVCGFSLDPTASAALWNIESFDSGAGCQP